MTEAKTEGPAAEIVRSILAEADQQGARILESARNAAAAEDARTEREAAQAEDGGGAGPAIALAYTEEAFGGGCTAFSPDGRVVFDNTFPRRMERLRRRIRAALVQEVADRDA